MRTLKSVLIVGGAIGFIGSGVLAAPIPVADGSFETMGGPIDGGGHWTAVDSVWNPVSGQSQYQQNNGDNITPEDGAFSLWVPNTGGISQDLNTVVQAGETLQVSFFGGNGAHPEFGTAGGGMLTATFTVGSTSYSQTFDTSTAPSGGWKQFFFDQPITNTGDLKLSFSVASAHPWLDNISSVTPEPASLGVLTVFGLSLMGRRRRA